VRGAILLNAEMNQVVLVKGWKKSAKWSFPRGKINKDEADLDCAIREVYEETGFEAREAGLVPDDRNAKYIDITLREQQMRLYVFRNVPMDTYFEPRTRKEISKIQWYKITELPGGKNKPGVGMAEDGPKNIFYMVAPFMNPLKQWIKQQRKVDRLGAGLHAHESSAMEDTDVEGGHADAPELASAESIHLQSLLSRMGRPAQASADESMAASTEKLGLELKKLLSVGVAGAEPVVAHHQQPNQDVSMGQPQSKGDQQSGILLSLLRGGNQQVTQSAQVPPTPLQQENSPAQRPHPNHPPNMMPPGFQFPGNPQQPGFQRPMHHQHMLMHMHQGVMPGMSVPGPQQQPFQPSFNQPQAGIYPVSGHAVPLQNTPPASNLPMPRMQPQYAGNGNHYNQMTVQQPQNQHQNQHQNPHQNQIQHPHQNQHQNPHQNMHQNHQNDQQAPEAYVPMSQELPSESERQIDAAQLSQHRPMQSMNGSKSPSMMQKTAQQNTLLGLFRNTGQAAATQSSIAPVAELSAGTPRDSLNAGHAARSPVGPPQHGMGGVGLYANRRLTSATVSGPLNEPDFDTIRRNRPPVPVELGSGREHGHSPVPVHTVGSSTILEAPRPFQPSSILQRQQQYTPSNATPANVPAGAPVGAVFDRRSQQPETQKTNLLSLFNAKPSPAAPPAATADTQKANLLSLFHSPASTHSATSQAAHAQVPEVLGFPTNMVVPDAHQRRLSQNESPVSPLPDKRVPYKAQNAGAAVIIPQASAVSSMSMYDGAGVPRSRVSSVTSAGAGSGGATGGQTPIAEDQKQFLFKYLEDAVRGGK
jgi:mRNA-decapping enzyme subunit 2